MLFNICLLPQAFLYSKIPISTIIFGLPTATCVTMEVGAVEFFSMYIMILIILLRFALFAALTFSDFRVELLVHVSCHFSQPLMPSSHVTWWTSELWSSCLGKQIQWSWTRYVLQISLQPEEDTLKCSKDSTEAQISFPLLFLLCFGLCHMVCGILVSWPRTAPGPSAMKALSPNHWAAREFPFLLWLCKESFPTWYLP